MAEDKIAALEREVRLMKDSFNKLAAEWRAEEARNERWRFELLAALEAGRGEVSEAIDRLSSALAEYNDARRGPGNGPASVTRLPRGKGGKGTHRA